MRREWRSALAALGLALAPFVLTSCRDSIDVKVSSLEFRGLQAIKESQLRAVLATRQSGWLPWSRRWYFDRREFEADLKRVTAFCADRGFPHARITDVNVDLSQDHKSVRLAITVDEGPPLVVDQLTLTGFDVLPASNLQSLREQLVLRPGAPLDVEHLGATRDAARHMLRESGYAYATVDAREGPTGQVDHVLIEIAASPGPKTYFGPVDVHGLTNVKRILVNRSMRFTPGEPYRESLLLRSQQRLASLEVFDFVNVKTEVPAGETPTALPTVVTVTEAMPKRLEFGVGYGSEDHFRGSVQWRHLNMGGAAQQFTTNAQWSSTLSGVSAGYSVPYPFRRATSADAKGYAWWTNIPTYDQQTYGATFNAVYRFTPPTGVHRRETRKDVFLRVSYRNEYQKYELTEQGTQDLTFSEKLSLGFDPVTGRGSGTLASLGADVDRAAVDRQLDPRLGYTASLHLEHAAPWLGGTFRFDEIRFDARGYHPIGRNVVALRFQIGTVTASAVEAVPVSSRYFLGGPTVMRGWGPFEVAPLSDAGTPLGGRSMLTLTAELRRPVTSTFGAVLFLEGGNAWSDSVEFHPGSLRYDIGSGIRWTSPVGIVRGDFGWQLTPIEGLRIDNELVTQRWRIQISLGQAF